MTGVRCLGARVAGLVLAMTGVVLGVGATTSPSVFDVRAYGAAGDGKAIDTRALQAAIDACAASGGGRVLIAGGTYLSGTLVLKSHVTLELDSGATLLGSTNLADYPVHVPAYRSYTDNYTDKSLIYAEKQEDIAIVGRGVIRGRGRDKAFKGKPYKSRPYLMRIVECQKVTVRDVTLRDSAMWVQHYLACDSVLIDGVTVHSLVNSNNDGIDIDSCEKVRISNCNIESGDDGICLKSTSAKPCRFVTVTNCIVRSDCNAFKCGTESNGGFQDIAVSNCAFYDTRLSGIALELVDGGAFERVTVSGITLKNVKGGIFVRLGNRARAFMDGQSKPAMGSMKDITIRDVQGTGVGPVGCMIMGLPDRAIENITFENIRIRYDGGGSAEMVNRAVPENEAEYPEFNKFGPMPAYGFHVRHARNVRFQHVDLAFEKEDARPAMVFDDVRDLTLADMKAQLAGKAPTHLIFRNVADALVQGCRVSEEIPFLQLQGARTNHIRVWNNDLGLLNEPVRRDDDVGKDAVNIR